MFCNGGVIIITENLFPGVPTAPHDHASYSNLTDTGFTRNPAVGNGFGRRAPPAIPGSEQLVIFHLVLHCFTPSRKKLSEIFNELKDVASIVESCGVPSKNSLKWAV